MDGLGCIFGIQPDDHSYPLSINDDYNLHQPVLIPTDDIVNGMLNTDLITTCNCSIYLFINILLYIVLAIIILEYVNRFIQFSYTTFYRLMVFSVLTSFILLGSYDTFIGSGNGLWNSHIYWYDILVIIMLLVGLEIYSKEIEPEIEKLTTLTNDFT